MNTPRFSVVIPTRDRPRQLAACLGALQRVEQPEGGFEVIVVDDGSRIPVAAAEQVTLLRLQSPRGPAAARNAGARIARGRYLVFLDDDCRPHAAWLSAYARTLVSHPASLLAGVTTNGETANRLACFNQALTEAVTAITRGSAARLVLSSNMCVPAELFWAVGGFDERFPTAGGEDRELCARWLAAGHAIGESPDARASHHHPQGWSTFWSMHRRYGAAARQVNRRISQKALMHETLARTGAMGVVPYVVSQVATTVGYLFAESGPHVSIDPVPVSVQNLSVILVSYNASLTIGHALESLRRQTVRGFETLVIDSSTDETARVVREGFPEVRLQTFARRLYPGAARNEACALARGSVIAFLDADCVAAPDWIESILRAHATGGPLIAGGSVGTANPKSLVGWAYFFSEFAPWLPVGPARFVRDVPTCCLSMRREAFERFGPFLESGYCSDTAFNWTASQHGQRPWFDPAMAVKHWNPEGLSGVLAKQRLHGESYACLRAERHQLSRVEALLRAATAPLLPWYLWTRTAWRVVRAPGFRWPFVKATPVLLLVLAAWACGEAAGYWKAQLARTGQLQTESS